MYPFFSSYSVVQDEMEQKSRRLKKKKYLSHDFSKICTWQKSDSEKWNWTKT